MSKKKIVSFLLMVVVVLLLLVAYMILIGNNPGELPVLGPPNHAVPAFTLTDQTGSASGSDILKDKILVADFIFTRCGSICPEMTSQLKRVQDQFSPEQRLHLLSFTVDPSYDSAHVLKDYMEHYGADENTWTMYTGSKKEIYDLARNGFMLTVDDGDGGPDDFIHSEKIVLLDTKRQIRGFYNGTDSIEVEQLIADIRFLLRR